MKIMIIYNTRGMSYPILSLRKRHINDCDLFIHMGNSMLDSNNHSLEGYLILEGDKDLPNTFLKDYYFDYENMGILFLSKNEVKNFRFLPNEFKNMKAIVTPINSQTDIKIHNSIAFIPVLDLNNKDSNYVILELGKKELIFNILSFNDASLLKSTKILFNS